ncbi:hypothetical protein HELRODRAFT_102759 [Helobdella robusta]|uniref:U4/U6.U5 tri-snRNP-associated protein 1 n=1 Tax=Helobdella robusta TaxID=6412 RepID=T1EDB4_HELRO|nr:hypothetical protein HELRODRAFT_102759 [Helobdella robusta]ESN94957.1 hypothetical protein HELRODRAFT_102759 [Helobdella robusta]
MGSTKKHKKDRDSNNEERNHKHKRRRSRTPREESRQKEQDVKKESPEIEQGHEKLSLSIEETNKLRAKLGLKLLELDDNKSDKKSEEKKDVHVPAHNIADLKRTEEIRERLKQAKEKRRIDNSMAKIKPLTEDGDESVLAWVEKSRRLDQERKQADERAKMLDEMDKDFGVDDLIKSEFNKISARKQYRSKDLQGLKIEHSDGNFKENKEVILTLKDKLILDEDDEDVLINVNMVDDEKAAKNVENKKARPTYNPYDEPEYDEFGNIKQKELLDKYDEEIYGAKKTFITIDNSGKIDNSWKEKMACEAESSRLDKIKDNLILKKPIIASEYYTAAEMESFKKPSKKVRKLRKRAKLTADDLLADEMEHTKMKSEIGAPAIKKQKIPGLDSVNIGLMEDDEDDILGPDDDLSGVVIEEDTAQLELELAIEKARKLKTQKSATSLLDIVSVIKSEPSSFDYGSSAVVMNSTAEFCRSLGDLPQSAMSSLKKNDEDDEDNMDDDDEFRGKGWQSVEIDEKPVNLKEQEVHVLDEEPIVNQGIGAALKLASKKGYLDSIVNKQISAPRHSKLEAQNYSIEDKRMDDLDDKYSRKRDRYSGSGPVVEFKEKDGYRPEIKLEYVDDAGKEMSKKEAFRYLSHKFHGKGSGKKKLEKRMKKAEDDVLMRMMSSTDTPLNTLQLLQERQKVDKVPYIILSGTKGLTSSIITKT